MMEVSQVRSFNWFEFGKPVHLRVETEAPLSREDAGKPYFKVYISDGSFVLICLRVDLASLLSLCDDMQKFYKEINRKLIADGELELLHWQECRTPNQRPAETHEPAA